VVLLLEGALVSWSLAIDERGGHGDLRGSGCLNLIPYIQERTELYCGKSVLPEPFLFLIDPCEEVSTRSFYNSRSDSYNETRGPTGGPELIETLYNI
jgi:hypothetical protein